MNYRRGLQRVYAVLTVVWVVVVVAVSLRNWSEPNDWVTIKDEYGGVPTSPPGKKFVPPPLDSFQPDAPTGRMGKYSDSDIATPVPGSPDVPLHVVSSEPLSSGHAPRSDWAYWSMMVLGAPALGYLFLFYVVPWVYRGFAPGTHK
jgi:hypothetical protein